MNVLIFDYNNDVNINCNNPCADWEKHQSAQQRITTMNQLDKYLEKETMSAEVDIDILQYWKMHLGTYPTWMHDTRYFSSACVHGSIRIRVMHIRKYVGGDLNCI